MGTMTQNSGGMMMHGSNGGAMMMQNANVYPMMQNYNGNVNPMMMQNYNGGGGFNMQNQMMM